MTREQALLMLGRFINLDRYSNETNNVSVKVSDEKDDRDVMAKLINAGVTKKLPGDFDVKQEISRLEMVQFINSVIYHDLETPNRNPFIDITERSKGYQDILKAAMIK